MRRTIRQMPKCKPGTTYLDLDVTSAFPNQVITKRLQVRAAVMTRSDGSIMTNSKNEVYVRFVAPETMQGFKHLVSWDTYEQKTKITKITPLSPRRTRKGVKRQEEKVAPAHEICDPATEQQTAPAEAAPQAAEEEEVSVTLDPSAAATREASLQLLELASTKTGAHRCADEEAMLAQRRADEEAELGNQIRAMAQQMMSRGEVARELIGRVQQESSTFAQLMVPRFYQ